MSAKKKTLAVQAAQVENVPDKSANADHPAWDRVIHLVESGAGGVTLPPTDGRLLRSKASKARIIGAILDFAQEGNVSPSAASVADRAKVGRRTVFSLFGDMESLYAEVYMEVIARIARYRNMSLEGATWQERLERLIDRRMQLFEEIAAIKRCADARRHRSPFMDRAHHEIRKAVREVLFSVLPPSIRDDEVRFEAIELALSLESWTRLRFDQALSADMAAKVWRHMALALTTD